MEDDWFMPPKGVKCDQLKSVVPVIMYVPPKSLYRDIFKHLKISNITINPAFVPQSLQVIAKKNKDNSDWNLYPYALFRWDVREGEVRCHGYRMENFRAASAVGVVGTKEASECWLTFNVAKLNQGSLR